MVKIRGASTVSLHFEKHKNGTSGLQRHVERVRGQKHSNKNINDERTDDNIFLIQKTGSYEERIKKIIESEYTGKRAVRKDAVKMVEATVQLGGDIIQNGTEEEQIEALKDAFEELKERYGEQNIVSAVIHVDETTPHLHFDFVPIQNGKLTAKKVLGDRAKMQRTQSEFLTAMNERTGLRFERKEENSLNGLTQKQYEAVKKRLDEVDEREERLVEGELNLEESTDALNRQKQGLNQREKQLDTRERNLQARTERLSQREKNLQVREENVSERLNLANTRDLELRKMEESLKKREATFRERMKEEWERLNEFKQKVETRLREVGA